MSASLVGSEMCIRDRLGICRNSELPRNADPSTGGAARSAAPPAPASREPVSYTHLTLPTICSV
eukprot:7142558-Alexandrium_andersonii.AAC.1